MKQRKKINYVSLPDVQFVFESFGFMPWKSLGYKYFGLSKQGLNFRILILENSRQWFMTSLTPIFPDFKTSIYFRTLPELFSLCCYICRFKKKDLKLKWVKEHGGVFRCLGFPMFTYKYQENGYTLMHDPLWETSIGLGVPVHEEWLLTFLHEENLLQTAEHMTSFYQILWYNFSTIEKI